MESLIHALRETARFVFATCDHMQAGRLADMTATRSGRLIEYGPTRRSSQPTETAPSSISPAGSNDPPPTSPQHFDSELDALQNLLLEMAGRARTGAAGDGGVARRDVPGPRRSGPTKTGSNSWRWRSTPRRELLALQHHGDGSAFVFVVLKACRDIERIGDHAVNIAGAGHRAAAHPPLPEIREIWEIGDRVRSMLSRALGALVNRDANTARAVIAEDEVVDTLRHSAFDLIVSYMQQQERYISPGVNMILVVQNLGVLVIWRPTSPKRSCFSSRDIRSSTAWRDRNER